MRTLVKQILTDLENIDGIKKDINHFIFGRPSKLDSATALKGAIMVYPRFNRSEPITTGIKESNEIELEFIIAKKVTNNNYINAQETATEWMVRVIEDTDNTNSLKTNTIKYTLRKNIRNYGKKQRQMQIEYDSKEFKNQGVVTATISLYVTDIYNIDLS